MCMPSRLAGRSAPSACAIRMPSPALKCARGASSGMASPPSPKCSRIIAALAWKPPQASTTASAGSVSPLARRTPVMAPLLGDQRVGRRSRSGTRRRPRARRGSARGGWSRRRQPAGCAAGLSPDNKPAGGTARRGRRSISPWRARAARASRNSPRRPGSRVASSMSWTNDRLDAVDRRHPHVGRCPAGVAAGVMLGRLVEQRDGNGDARRAASAAASAADRPAAPWPTTTMRRGLTAPGRRRDSARARRRARRRAPRDFAGSSRRGRRTGSSGARSARGA